MRDIEHRPQWYSFTSYVLVTTGALVGLGNVFQFPFLAIKYGGLFILFYIICQLTIALPLLFAELLIGRRGKQNPVGSIGLLTIESDANYHWRALGWSCVLIAFLTMIYYTVIAAFPIGYFIDNVKDIYQHATPLNGSIPLHNEAVSSFAKLETWFIVFVGLAMIVVYRGIHRGLEEISMITVPLYFIILLLLAIYISTLGYFGDSVSRIFTNDPHISLYEIFLAALALAFMKYKTGMGVMIVYGSYLPYHVSLAKSTLLVVIIDALVSLFSYFIVYPLTLTGNAEVLSELSTHNVVTIFNGLPGGLIISAVFFFAAILIAWTPIIAMAETVVVTLMERLYLSRTYASIMLILLILLCGSFEAASQFEWANVKIWGDYSLHNLLKNITLDVLTPMVVFFIAIFIGWVVSRDVTEEELRFKPIFYRLWRFLIRYVVPIAVLVVLFTVTVLEQLPF